MKRLGVYSPKDRIEHSVYGLGTIVQANERHTTIDFDEGATREFLTGMVNLAPSNAPSQASYRPEETAER
jgi:hypothetical protein